MYKVFHLYQATGAAGAYAPEGFKESPNLETYLNYLHDQGYVLVGVTSATDARWYQIITRKSDDGEV